VSGPAPIAALDAVSLQLGDKLLLDNLTLGLVAGDRIGVVGRNGAGKSTMVRVLTGAQPPDRGRVVVGSTRIGLLQQADPGRDGTVADLVLSDHETPHRWEADAHAREVLGGLGVDRQLDRELSTLSGGERRRAELARLLITDLDLLVLDEPTNHLDIPGITWLAQHLTSRGARHRALLAVTHDRWFLDEVCTQTWEVADGDVHRYDGGYGAYVLARAERGRQRATEAQKQSNLVRKELAWLRRGAPARTSKPRYRVAAAEALIATEPPPRDTQALRRFATARLGRTVYELQDVSRRQVLRHVTRAAGPGERIGLLGRNGAGKSTLLRLLAGEDEPDSGRLVRGLTVTSAHLSQHVSELPPQQRVLQAVQEVAQVLKVGDRELSAGQLAELFGFANDRQWTPVGDLSGGERRRLQLLRLLVAGPNVLLLDEPTNDLDLDTLMQLEDLLDGWPGTLVVASHDRWFLERVCDTVWAMDGAGALTDVPGGVQAWLGSLAAVSALPSGPGPGVAGSTTGASTTGASTTADEATRRQARKDLSRIEKAMQRSLESEKRLHDQLAAAASDHARILGLDADLRQLLLDRSALEESWLSTAELAEG
jgi:ATP-binding cassette subfamily F protein uup